MLPGFEDPQRPSGLRLLTAQLDGDRRNVNGRAWRRGDQAALGAFVAVVAAALVYYVTLARRQWFGADEWDFVAGRTGGDLADLFRPHNEHWSTLPIIAFRLLWQVVGVRSYLPYLLLIVMLHLAVACLLRTVMRRAGVNPWIATAAATLFVLFGTGHDNILWAFQIGFVGALVFGLSHLLLADHDGPIDRRDVLGLVAGLAGLMCSGVGVPMVAAVGLATLVRRGWRLALFHVAPLAVVYCVWLATSAGNSYSTRAGLGQVARFTGTDLRATFEALGQLPGSGIVLGALLLVGLALAWWPRLRDDLPARAAAPGALLGGAVLFLAITGFGRAGQPLSVLTQPWDASRYLHIVAALVLPALAVGLDAIARRLGRPGTVAAVVVLLVGVPGNLSAVDTYVAQTGPSLRIFRHAILATPKLAITRDLPRSYKPFLPFVPSVTVGWLLDSEADGRVPGPGHLSRRERSELTLALVLRPAFGHTSGARCTTIVGSGRHQLERGDVILVAARSRLDVSVVEGSRPMVPVGYGGSERRLALRSVIALPLQMTARGGRAQMCRAPLPRR